jgi:protein phosphatase 1 regulatory subunit 37
MALSKGLKAHHVMQCLDVNIPPDNEEFARICRDILNTCVRNTEEAERAARGAGGAGDGHGHGHGHANGHGHQGGAPPTSGKVSSKSMWGLIEESELARSIRMGDELHGKVRLHWSWSDECTNGTIYLRCRRTRHCVRKRCWHRGPGADTAG